MQTTAQGAPDTNMTPIPNPNAPEGSTIQTPTPQPQSTTQAQPAQSAQPAAPAQPTATPQGQPAQPIMQHAPATPQSSLHARLFDGILKTISGGPIMVQQTDPTTGDTRQVEVPQSRSKMANSILAGVLSSMFTGAQGRGASPDYKPVLGSHGTQHAEEQAKQQAIIDQNQDRKMKTLDINLKTIQTQMAAARAGEEVMDKQINDGAAQVALAQTHDENLPTGEDPAIQKKRVTSEEAMKMIGDGKLGLVAIPTEWSSHLDPATGKVVKEPLYTVLNPHIKVKLSEDDVKAMAQTNPAMADAWERSGGNMELPFDVVNNARQTRGKVYNVQAALEQIVSDKDVAKELGVTGKLGNLMDLAKDKTYRDALQNTEAQMAAHAGSDRHYSILSAMLESNGGPALAQKLGINVDKANEWLDKTHNERISAEATAKLGGVGDKAIAAPETKNEVTSTIQNDGTLTEPQKKILLAGLSPNMTNGQLKDLKKQSEGFSKANQSDAVRSKLAGGDPKVAGETAGNILDGNLASIEKIAPNRSDARQVLSNAVIAEAKQRNLDPNNWGPEALEAKVKMWGDYHSNDQNKTGANVGAFRTFLNHADEAATISDQWKRTGSPVLDKPMGELEKTGFGGTEFANFERSLEPVRKEYMSFLNANRAEHDADIQIMQTVLNSSSTPRQVTDALSYLASSADKRLAEVARTYNNTMGTTMPTILSPQAMDVLKRFNVKSMTAPLVADLPKGNGQKIDPKNAAVFQGAAGGDLKIAREMAKQAGWTL